MLVSSSFNEAVYVHLNTFQLNFAPSALAVQILVNVRHLVYELRAGSVRDTFSVTASAVSSVGIWRSEYMTAHCRVCSPGAGQTSELRGVACGGAWRGTCPPKALGGGALGGHRREDDCCTRLHLGSTD